MTEGGTSTYPSLCEYETEDDKEWNTTVKRKPPPPCGLFMTMPGEGDVIVINQDHKRCPSVTPKNEDVGVILVQYWTLGTGEEEQERRKKTIQDPTHHITLGLGLGLGLR